MCTGRQWDMKNKENVYSETVGNEGKGECVQGTFKRDC